MSVTQIVLTRKVIAHTLGIIKQGPPGAAGATGATGPQGPQGPIGPQGPAGSGIDYSVAPTIINAPTTLTDAARGNRYRVQTYIPTVTSVDDVTDIMEIVAHGLVVNAEFIPQANKYGLTSGRVCWVHTVVDENHIKVKETPDGAVKDLSADSGTFTAKCSIRVTLYAATNIGATRFDVAADFVGLIEFYDTTAGTLTKCLAGDTLTVVSGGTAGDFRSELKAAVIERSVVAADNIQAIDIIYDYNVMGPLQMEYEWDDNGQACQFFVNGDEDTNSYRYSSGAYSAGGGGWSGSLNVANTYIMVMGTARGGGGGSIKMSNGYCNVRDNCGEGTQGINFTVITHQIQQSNLRLMRFYGQNGNFQYFKLTLKRMK